MHQRRPRTPDQRPQESAAAGFIAAEFSEQRATNAIIPDVASIADEEGQERRVTVDRVSLDAHELGQHLATVVYEGRAWTWRLLSVLDWEVCPWRRFDREDDERAVRAAKRRAKKRAADAEQVARILHGAQPDVRLAEASPILTKLAMRVERAENVAAIARPLLKAATTPVDRLRGLAIRAVCLLHDISVAGLAREVEMLARRSHPCWGLCSSPERGDLATHLRVILHRGGVKVLT